MPDLLADRQLGGSRSEPEEEVSLYIVDQNGLLREITVQSDGTGTDRDGRAISAAEVRSLRNETKCRTRPPIRVNHSIGDPAQLPLELLKRQDAALRLLGATRMARGSAWFRVLYAPSVAVLISADESPTLSLELFESGAAIWDLGRQCGIGFAARQHWVCHWFALPANLMCTFQAREGSWILLSQRIVRSVSLIEGQCTMEPASRQGRMAPRELMHTTRDGARTEQLLASVWNALIQDPAAGLNEAPVVVESVTDFADAPPPRFTLSPYLLSPVFHITDSIKSTTSGLPAAIRCLLEQQLIQHTPECR